MTNVTNQLRNIHMHDATISTAPGRSTKDLTEADNLIRTLHTYAESKIKGAKRGRNLVYGNHYELDLLNERPPMKVATTNAPASSTTTTTTTTTATSEEKEKEKKEKSHILDVTSWKMNEFEYSSGALPTLARGLFTYLDTSGLSKAPATSASTTTSTSTSPPLPKNRHKNRKQATQSNDTPKLVEEDTTLPVLTGSDALGVYRILVRGYDKFFNVGEVPKTASEWIAENTEGPYEVTLKENGCIIFMSGLPPHLVGPEGGCIVTSKHSLGYADPETGKMTEVTHAGKGREWLEKGLMAQGKSVEQFGRWLWDHNLTAVAEVIISRRSFQYW